MTATLETPPAARHAAAPDAGDAVFLERLHAIEARALLVAAERDQAKRRERDMLAANLLLQRQLDAVSAVNRTQIGEIRDLHDAIERLQAENERLRGVDTLELPKYVPTRRGGWRRSR